jgi:hypothetical protein
VVNLSDPRHRLINPQTEDLYSLDSLIRNAVCPVLQHQGRCLLHLYRIMILGHRMRGAARVTPQRGSHLLLASPPSSVDARVQTAAVHLHARILIPHCGKLLGSS